MHPPLYEVTVSNKIANHNVVLLKYHEAHLEVSNRRLGELFGISKVRVGQIIKRDKRDRMVIEYFRAHPDASPAKVKVIFHISERRVHSLMPTEKISLLAGALVYPES